MTIQLVTGDLFATDGLEAYAHGVNLSGVMGAGIAAQMKKEFPSMHHVYLEECHRGLHSLGSVMRWDHMPYRVRPANPKYIFNCFTQNKPGPNADLTAVGNSLYEVMRQCQHLEVPYLGIPMIGAGIGGLPPEDVLEVFHYVSSKWPETDIIVFENYQKGINAKYDY